jgi:hypothetical protein
MTLYSMGIAFTEERNRMGLVSITCAAWMGVLGAGSAIGAGALLYIISRTNAGSAKPSSTTGLIRSFGAKALL